MRIHIDHTLLMVLTSFLKGSVHLSRGKSDFKTLIYIYSDVMCLFPQLCTVSTPQRIKAAPQTQPSLLVSFSLPFFHHPTVSILILFD